MSKQKKWGGARKGAGRHKDGSGKKKICVSVAKDNWQAAVSRWRKMPSHLVDGLISGYVKATAEQAEKWGVA